MCETLSWRLEPVLCPLHPTSTYTCGVIIMLKMHSGKNLEREKTSRKLNKKTRQLFIVY